MSVDEQQEQPPATEPRGARMPPPRTPPTAVGVSTPPPPRPPVPAAPHFPHTHPARRPLPFAEAFRSAVNGVLDVADALVERLEEAARR
jgi:hypothetical protein